MSTYSEKRDGEAPAEPKTSFSSATAGGIVNQNKCLRQSLTCGRIRLSGNLILINGNACGASSSFTTHSAKPELRKLGGSLALPVAGRLKQAINILCLLVLPVSGCHRDMRDQPRYEAQEASTFFPTGQADRPIVVGTVARGQLNDDDEVHTGKADGRFSHQIPIPIGRTQLERGQERFNIYCAPCHAQNGAGGGIIVQRGFPRAPSFHQDRLRQAPAGHYFDVMTYGFGAMPRYAVQLTPHDRWAIVAYIRALQLSQNAKLEDVPKKIQEQLNKEQP